MTSLPMTPVADNKPLMTHQSSMWCIQKDKDNYKDIDKDNDKNNDISPTDTSGWQQTTYNDAPEQHVIYTKR